MSILHNLSRRVARGTGYHILSEWRLHHWPLANHLRRLFDLHDVSVVLDVGANKGQFGSFLRQHVGWTGPIVSFEPAPVNLPDLRRAAERDGTWLVYPCALGRHPATLPMNVMRSTALSSFHTPVHPMTTKAGVASNTVHEVVDVPVRTLAEVWPELTAKFGTIRAHLKMDTQGFDLEVFAGAAPILGSLVTAQSEVAFVRLYDNAPDYQTALNTFATAGFVVTGMFAVGHEPATLQAREFDCTMVNARAEPALRP